MKTKYIFIHCEKELTADTVIYSVYVGKSKQDAAAVKRLQECTRSTDFYFKPYSADVCCYLEKIHLSFSEKPWYVDDVPPQRQVSLKDLLKMVRERFFPTLYMPRGHFAQAYALDTHFRSSFNFHNE